MMERTSFKGNDVCDAPDGLYGNEFWASGIANVSYEADRYLIRITKGRVFWVNHPEYGFMEPLRPEAQLSLTYVRKEDV